MTWSEVCCNSCFATLPFRKTGAKIVCSASNLEAMYFAWNLASIAFLVCTCPTPMITQPDTISCLQLARTKMTRLHHQRVPHEQRQHPQHFPELQKSHGQGKTPLRPPHR